MKILVTGAAGFVGSNSAEKLLERGDQVIGLDNFDDYYDPRRKRHTISILNKYPQFQLIEDDVRNRDNILELCANEKFDAILHLAGMAGVRYSAEHPFLYVEVNQRGTQNLFDGARYNRIRNFVMASTSSIYGDTKIIPFVETDPCVKPVQPYAASKRAAELLAYSYNRLYEGFNFTSCRLFTVYGTRGRPDMMAFKLADSIKNGTEIDVYDIHKMRRDWTYIDDITDGLLSALDRPMGHEIINIGRGQPIGLKQFIALMENIAGGKGNYVHKSKPNADVYLTYANIDKARGLLGYSPKVSVEEGVQRFWNWFEEFGDVDLLGSTHK